MRCNVQKDYDKVFTLAEGKMTIIDGKYVILPGSKLKETDKERFIKMRTRAEIKNNVVIKEISFDTPSGAAELINGYNTNGKKAWKHDNIPLENFL